MLINSKNKCYYLLGLIDGLYENSDELEDELLVFLVYYNEHRTHSALNGLTPNEFYKKNKKKCN
jgi:transposase InsO family protein